MVAQPVAVQLPAVLADPYRAARLHQLLVVAAGELLARALHGLVGLAPEHGRAAPVDEVHRTGEREGSTVNAGGGRPSRAGRRAGRRNRRSSPASSEKGSTTSKRMPAASKASLLVTAGRRNMKATRPSGR